MFYMFVARDAIRFHPTNLNAAKDYHVRSCPEIYPLESPHLLTLLELLLLVVFTNCSPIDNCHLKGPPVKGTQKWLINERNRITSI